MVIKGAEQGLSLIESLITLTVIAVLSAMAAPAWNDWLQRRRLAGISAELVTDLQYVRSEAVVRNTNMRLSFLAVNGGSCYLIHTGLASDCSCSDSGIGSCTAPEQAVKTVFQPSSQGVSFQSNSSSLLYSARLGTATPTGTIRVSTTDGTTIRHVVNLMGRVRLCSENASALGHPVCS